MLQSQLHLRGLERPKPEASAARLEGRDDLGQVVAYQAESDVLSELLYNCSQKRNT